MDQDTSKNEKINDEVAETLESSNGPSNNYILNQSSENLEEVTTANNQATDEVQTVVEEPRMEETKQKPRNVRKKIPRSIQNKIDKGILTPMVIDYNGPHGVKSDTKLIYQFSAIAPNGTWIQSYIEAYSVAEVHSYLLSEGYQVYDIKTSKWINKVHSKDVATNVKMKTKDLVFLLTQLSTYIKAGIPLADAMRVLVEQYKKPAYKQILQNIVHNLVNGDAFSVALEKAGKAFPKLLINMVRVSEMTGDLPGTLDEMADYYGEIEKTRKQMITAMMYPTMVFVFAVAVIIFVLVWVIPQFVEIYESMDPSKIPAFTKLVIAISDFLKKDGIWLALGITIFVVLYVYLYKNVRSIRETTQWLVMHIPVFSNVVIYNEVTMFTKTFASLLKYNVFITDSMEILMRVTNNEIYKQLIYDTIQNLSHGEKISYAFKDHWAFPLPAYTMLITGEKTGQLPEMMEKVAEYYQEQHTQSVTRIKTFIEPVLIIFLTVNVGIIILSIVLPMFGMYEMVM